MLINLIKNLFYSLINSIFPIAMAALILWMWYPIVHVIFPNAAKNGTIAKSLSYMTCFYIMTLIIGVGSIVIKAIYEEE